MLQSNLFGLTLTTTCFNSSKVSGHRTLPVFPLYCEAMTGYRQLKGMAVNGSKKWKVRTLRVLTVALKPYIILESELTICPVRDNYIGRKEIKQKSESHRDEIKSKYGKHIHTNTHPGCFFRTKP